MDPMRQLRLLIPPFFFFMAIISADYFSDVCNCKKLFQVQDLGGVAGLVALIVVSALPIGFVINTFSMVVLRCVYRMCGNIMETDITDKEAIRMCHLLGVDLHLKDASSDEIEEHKLYIVSACDHELFYNHAKGIQELTMRSYTAFTISQNSVVSLVAAFFIVLFLDITPPYLWYIVVVLLIVLLWRGAVVARNETFKTSRFNAKRLRFSEEIG